MAHYREFKGVIAGTRTGTTGYREPDPGRGLDARVSSLRRHLTLRVPTTGCVPRLVLLAESNESGS